MIRTDQAGLTITDIFRLNSPGFIMGYGGSSAPGGWFFCDGSTLDEVTYAALFAVIGTTFNDGLEPVGEFRLPDFRGRSIMGAGTGSGLTPRVNGETLGNEEEILSVSQLANHTHIQDAHTHTQNAHTHTQDAHTHTQDSHNHTLTDPGHNHTTVDHTHTQNAHTHTQDAHFHITVNGAAYTAGTPSIANGDLGLNAQRNSGTGSRGSDDTTATNQNTTATNNNANVTVQSSTTGVASTATTATNQNTTATNQNTTATNQNTTATNQSTGNNDPVNIVHPVLVVNMMIKF